MLTDAKDSIKTAQWIPRSCCSSITAVSISISIILNLLELKLGTCSEEHNQIRNRICIFIIQ